jgi:hypothetical protein
LLGVGLDIIDLLATAALLVIAGSAAEASP